jgi:hypothetical protein
MGRKQTSPISVLASGLKHSRRDLFTGTYNCPPFIDTPVYISIISNIIILGNPLRGLLRRFARALGFGLT